MDDSDPPPRYCVDGLSYEDVLANLKSIEDALFGRTRTWTHNIPPTPEELKRVPYPSQPFYEVIEYFKQFGKASWGGASGELLYYCGAASVITPARLDTVESYWRAKRNGLLGDIVHQNVESLNLAMKRFKEHKESLAGLVYSLRFETRDSQSGKPAFSRWSTHHDVRLYLTPEVHRVFADRADDIFGRTWSTPRARG
ncbi:hypothetical protein NMY22_g1499 [Coprinellus aureogranulatus]|nr:hypothetical protein NMY22_g1499 [Coprinellus aureogranulatus]